MPLQQLLRSALPRRRLFPRNHGTPNHTVTRILRQSDHIKARGSLFFHRFVYRHCIENGHTEERAGVTLSAIGSEIQETGFPRPTGRLRRLLERRSELFQVFDRPRQGTLVYAHDPPRRTVTSQAQPPQPLRPQVLVTPLSNSYSFSSLPESPCVCSVFAKYMNVHLTPGFPGLVLAVLLPSTASRLHRGRRSHPCALPLLPVWIVTCACCFRPQMRYVLIFVHS